MMKASVNGDESILRGKLDGQGKTQISNGSGDDSQSPHSAEKNGLIPVRSLLECMADTSVSQVP